MTEIKTEKYKTEANRTLKDQVIQNALSGFQHRLGKATADAYRNLPEGPDLRLKAHDMRMHAIENLDVLLAVFSENLRKNGGHLYFAEDAQAAVDYCLKVARRHNVKRIVKGKSMLTEEIGLNPALMADGIDVAETDLGEFIIQLAGESPFHLLGPALHKTRNEVGQLFSEKLGIPYTNDPPTLTRAARIALRDNFFAADMGISGCNLACAETGHITVVSNEGNIRMATTLPKVHLAFMGMERIVARLEDHDSLFRLLSRGAAAQNMATYISYIGGPRGSGHADGPDEFHVVVVDNGRMKILEDEEFREILCCIRCSACLNVCPVYGKIGGHAYGYAYSGPVGAVITPLLVGINRAKDLCLGETLCGACQEACPVDNNIPRMLLGLRAKLADGDPEWNVIQNSIGEKAIYKAWSWVISNRRRYDFFLRLGMIGQKFFPKENGMIHRMPFPFNGWTRTRDMIPISAENFMQQWKTTTEKRSSMRGPGKRSAEME